MFQLINHKIFRPDSECIQNNTLIIKEKGTKEGRVREVPRIAIMFLIFDPKQLTQWNWPLYLISAWNGEQALKAPYRIRSSYSI